MSTRRVRFARRGTSRGQALVEFSLVLPIFFMLVLGLIDGGRLVFAYNTVAQTARDAARLAAVEASFIGATGPNCTAPVCPANTTAYRADIKAAADHASVIIGKIPNDPTHLAVGCAAAGSTNTTNDCAPSSYTYSGGSSVVTVKITMPISPITPIWGFFYPDDLTATSTMVLP